MTLLTQGIPARSRGAALSRAGRPAPGAAESARGASASAPAHLGRAGAVHAQRTPGTHRRRTTGRCAPSDVRHSPHRRAPSVHSTSADAIGRSVARGTAREAPRRVETAGGPTVKRLGSAVLVRSHPVHVPCERHAPARASHTPRRLRAEACAHRAPARGDPRRFGLICRRSRSRWRPVAHALDGKSRTMRNLEHPIRRWPAEPWRDPYHA